ncbi:MAG: maleylpyruvate isomerase N-terminal domain-containing protein [Acidimicrobiales bacterium]
MGFDPVATPAAMVAGTSEQAPAEVLADYHRACDDLLDALADLEPEQWQLIAEGPPGHLQMQGIVRHALWDGWIHERDVALPLGVTPDQEADELAAVLEYAIALGPGLQATLGSERTGTLAAVADELDDAVVVEIGPTVTIGRRPTPDGTPTLRGGAVDLIEGLSLRAPFAPDLADEDPLDGGGPGRGVRPGPADLAQGVGAGSKRTHCVVPGATGGVEPGSITGVPVAASVSMKFRPMAG